LSKTNSISLKETWRNTWSSAISRSQLITGSVLLAILLSLLPFFFNTIEKRKGVQLDDWVLAHIPACNVSIYIFALIWGTAALAFYRAARKPAMYVTYVWAYSFIVLLRMITISVIKLDPPLGIIHLVDPLTGIFYGHANITKDLFFSGHTATLFLIFLTLEKKWDKILSLIAVIIVGVLLLVQHVHYTLDVLMAPIAVYPVYKTVVYILTPRTKQNQYL